ncbi:hypothetical protein ES708_29882 [subsurface metagenome]
MLLEDLQRVQKLMRVALGLMAISLKLFLKYAVLFALCAINPPGFESYEQ